MKFVQKVIKYFSASNPRTLILLVAVLCVSAVASLIIPLSEKSTVQRISQTQELTPTPTEIPSATPTGTPTTVPTISQSSSSIRLSIKIPGVGSNTSLGENPAPKHREKDFKIQLFDKDDKLTKEVEGRLNFDGAFYEGVVQIPNIEFGNYTIKIKSNNSLNKSALGVISLQNGVTTQISQVTLVSGNVNDSGESKNNLNISDYNSVISYFGKSVNDVEGELADLNDDGVVTEKDVNILLRGFLIRKGD